MGHNAPTPSCQDGAAAVFCKMAPQWAPRGLSLCPCRFRGAPGFPLLVLGGFSIPCWFLHTLVTILRETEVSLPSQSAVSGVFMMTRGNEFFEACTGDEWFSFVWNYISVFLKFHCSQKKCSWGFRRARSKASVRVSLPCWRWVQFSVRLAAIHASVVYGVHVGVGHVGEFRGAKRGSPCSKSTKCTRAAKSTREQVFLLRELNIPNFTPYTLFWPITCPQV